MLRSSLSSVPVNGRLIDWLIKQNPCFKSSLSKQTQWWVGWSSKEPEIQRTCVCTRLRNANPACFILMFNAVQWVLIRPFHTTIPRNKDHWRRIRLKHALETQKKKPRIFPPTCFLRASSWSMMPAEVVRTTNLQCRKNPQSLMHLQKESTKIISLRASPIWNGERNEKTSPVKDHFHFEKREKSDDKNSFLKTNKINQSIDRWKECLRTQTDAKVTACPTNDRNPEWQGRIWD